MRHDYDQPLQRMRVSHRRCRLEVPALRRADIRDDVPAVAVRARSALAARCSVSRRVTDTVSLRKARAAVLKAALEYADALTNEDPKTGWDQVEAMERCAIEFRNEMQRAGRR